MNTGDMVLNTSSTVEPGSPDSWITFACGLTTGVVLVVSAATPAEARGLGVVRPAEQTIRYEAASSTIENWPLSESTGTKADLVLPDTAVPFGGTPLEVTRLAQDRIAGRESVLESIMARLSEAIGKRGYRAIRYSLTAYVSREVPTDDVMLYVFVSGIPDTKTRLSLWDELSELLSETQDSFVVERLSLVVESNR